MLVSLPLPAVLWIAYFKVQGLRSEVGMQCVADAFFALQAMQHSLVCAVLVPGCEVRVAYACVLYTRSRKANRYQPYLRGHWP
jgi:hypothetical protein